jgi:hypothetical protein
MSETSELSDESLKAIQARADDFNAAMDRVAADIRRWSQPDEITAMVRAFHRFAWLTRPAPWPDRRSKRARRLVATRQSVRVIDRKGRAHWRRAPSRIRESAGKE